VPAGGVADPTTGVAAILVGLAMLVTAGVGAVTALRHRRNGRNGHGPPDPEDRPARLRERLTAVEVRVDDVAGDLAALRPRAVARR